MPATVQDLLARTREAAARQHADAMGKYAKLVVRVARGEEVAPDAILTALTSWQMDPDTFTADVERTADRIALRKLADQRGLRAQAAAAARAAHAQVVAGWEAAAAALNAEWGARADAALAEQTAAEAAARAADAAHGRLEVECPDAPLLARLRELDEERRKAAFELDSIRSGITAAEAEIRDISLRMENVRGADTEANAAKLDRHRGRIADLQPRVAPAEARVSAVEAEAAALRPRLLEPWPVGAGPLK